jgi:hypothetical protein
MINETHIYLLFLVVIFFIYGLILSKIIDHIFPTLDDNKHNYYITIEVIAEIGLAYLVYFLLNRNIKYCINYLLVDKKMNKYPSYVDQLLLISFSFGIYKHLEKSTHKMNYLKEKFIKFNNI